MLKHIILFLVVFGLATSAASGAGLAWQEYRGEHFIIRYHASVPAEYIKQLGRSCERYYSLIAERLGLRRFNFWTWENRAQIFIYGSRETYLKGRGRPEWSAASVAPGPKEIYTFYSGEDSLGTIFPHEITHLILREYIGEDNGIPLWFEEGLACVNEESYLEPENEFYSQAAARVGFLLREYGREYLVKLCRMVRDGSSFDKAMDKVYGSDSR